MKLKRLLLVLSTLGLTLALFVTAFHSAPTYAANGYIAADTNNIPLAHPQENPTLIPKTPNAGLPPIDIGTLLGDNTATPTPADGVTNPVIQNDFTTCAPIDDQFLTIECKDGALNFTRKETAGTRYIYYTAPLTDAVIQVTVRLPSQKNARYGVIFRLDDQFKNYYLLGVSNQGEYGLFRFADDHYETIIPYTASIDVGNASFPTKIKIINQGDVIAINLGGEWVDSIRDPNLTSGHVALFVEPDEPNQTVLFDDLNVAEILSPLPVPEPRVVQPATTPTPTSDSSIVFPTVAAPTSVAQPPTQTPFVIVVTATPEPKTAVPPRVPTHTPTTAACGAAPNEALLYVSNNYPGTTMRFTIGGGEWKTHDFDIPGDGKYYFLHMPPGTYTYTAFIPGKGKANGERTEYQAGQCYSIRFSP